MEVGSYIKTVEVNFAGGGGEALRAKEDSGERA